MKPITQEAEELTSLDRLVNEQARRIQQKLGGPHTLKDLEREARTLYELIRSFKFRDELLKRLVEPDATSAQRRQIEDTLLEHRRIVRNHASQLDRLISKSHKLIEKSERLFAQLGTERPLAMLSPALSANLLLRSLPDRAYRHLIINMERVSLTTGTIVYRAEEPIKYVYFPETAVFSTVATMKNGTCVEVSLTGRQGMIGLRAMLGSLTTPAQTIVQVAGTALRASAEMIQEEVNLRSPLGRLLLRFSQAMLNQLRVSVACNHYHSVDERLAKWLLTMRDCVQSDALALTQGMMAQMIGSRLAGVSEAATRLKKAGAIRYSRGRLEILDKRKLEAAACECYEISKREMSRLFQSQVAGDAY